MIYFTSDLHFYHDNIIKHVGRPFRNADEMNHVLIQNWNQRIQDRDEVYILGDVTMKGPSHASAVLAQLHGRKYLIKGNHDSFAEKMDFPADVYLGWVKDYYELKYQGVRFVLSHYPMLEWNGMYRGAIHLHGHQHNRVDYNTGNRVQGLLRYDVGVDANRMTPVSIEEILEFFDGK